MRRVEFSLKSWFADLTVRIPLATNELMTIPLDPTITPEHHPEVYRALMSAGLPATVEISEDNLSIVAPLYASSTALEILRPVVESILHRIVTDIRSRKK